MSDLAKIADDNGSEFFYYFAYGSNLLTERIHVSNPSAVFQHTGKLDGYSLTFSDKVDSWCGGTATIFPAEASHVYGVVWKLAKCHLASLDAQEGPDYRRFEVEVAVLPTSGCEIGSNESVRCQTYMKDPIPVGARLANPSPHYKHVVVCGAAEHNLPSEYVDKLRSVEHNDYDGLVKHNHLEVFKSFMAS